MTGRGKIKNFSAGVTPWAHLNEYVTSVVIGEGITYIGSSAFYCFAAIENVELPSTLVGIGRYVFYGCSALTSIDIPEAVTEIGAYSFRRSGITEANFGTGYGWSAGDHAFTLDEITAGGWRFIAKSYYKVNWTRDVNAPVETLDPNYVDSGICLNDIIWEITRLENGKLKLTIRGNAAMPDFSTAGAPWSAYAAEIVEIEIGEGITTIGRCAFYGLKKVTTVTIADTVTAIGDYGFYMCKALTEIELPEGVVLGNDVFVKTGVTV